MDERPKKITRKDLEGIDIPSRAVLVRYLRNRKYKITPPPGTGGRAKGRRQPPPAGNDAPAAGRPAAARAAGDTEALGDVRDAALSLRATAAAHGKDKGLREALNGGPLDEAAADRLRIMYEEILQDASRVARLVERALG